MSFTKVLHTQETLNGLLLLEDCLESSAQHLLNHIYDEWLGPVGNNNSSKKSVWFINQSIPLIEYTKLAKKYNNVNFVVIDCYSDPFGWKKNEQQLAQTQSQQQQQSPIVFNCTGQDSASCLDALKLAFNSNRVPQRLKDNPILIINTLSAFVLKNGLSDTCNLVRTLINYNFNNVHTTTTSSTTNAATATATTTSSKNKIDTGIQPHSKKSEKSFSCVLGILHSDLHYSDQTVERQLQYISSTSIQVTPLPAKLLLSQSLSNPYEATITVITKKRSGRVLRNVEYYYVKNGRLEFDSADLFEKKEEEKEADPTQNLSFNLKLTDEEKAAKDSVVLPYRHQGENQLVIEDVIDDDDYDDEDPDDDLDI
ncbi:hypothetical protein SAMD00019534_082780 [Acytostelium subglobosum LB1]|uniref:hypothetical protein n=1 Tax=Acytostelium subglobosum LB1 TaxID=1410327 RepID=UPI000644BD9E|nr:hypothetical protein SAMD00019534_082780 [Acytostelium subglobosum LB1]GAM25103.1 hypothetical protein SAMD00019534_082780 [Acytostelium subglobosum LB1]|eukprot:XP_012752192.1 hypothetical protein SAMD00019534_082780 [Acytostelium subglobosum LB1]